MRGSEKNMSSAKSSCTQSYVCETVWNLICEEIDELLVKAILRSAEPQLDCSTARPRHRCLQRSFKLHLLHNISLWYFFCSLENLLPDDSNRNLQEVGNSCYIRLHQSCRAELLQPTLNAACVVHASSRAEIYENINHTCSLYCAVGCVNLGKTTFISGSCFHFMF